MVDILRRSLAPIPEEAWRQIDELASRTIKALLTGRLIVDFSGPHGWELAAVNTGRLQLGQQPGHYEAPWGLRDAQPLVEVRIPFHLNQMALDTAARGNRNIDLAELEEMARRIALFEETTLYKGFGPGRIQGLLQQPIHAPLTLPANPADYPAVVAQALKILKLAGIGSPYTLVLGPDLFGDLVRGAQGAYPPHHLVREMLQGDILMSSVLDGAIVLSTRGGDFEIIVGQDHSIGYATHDRNKVELFITESFTFRILTPSAVVVLQRG